MPRSKRTIPQRSATVAALSAPTEWEITHWQGLWIGGLGFETHAEFVDAWESFRDLVLPAWIATMPGSRPFAAYVVGEIPVPPMLDPPLGIRDGRTIGNATYHAGRRYGIGAEPELEHLVGLGLIGATEERAARLRIGKHGCRDLYRFVNRETPAEAACHD
jgi:hypothetical protein